MMKPFETFEHEGLQHRLYYDELYHQLHRTRGGYGYGTEEEIAKLNSGEWVVIGVKVFKPCPCKKTCPNCDGWAETGASCWGIVVENNEAAIKAAALEL